MLDFNIFTRDSIFFDSVLGNSIDMSIDFVVLLNCFSITDSNIDWNESVTKTRLLDFWNTLLELL